SKPTAARPDFYDLPAGFMARDDSLISFGTLAKVLVINTANVGTTNGRCLHSQQHFPISGMRYRQSAKLDFVISRQECSPHLLRGYDLLDLWHGCGGPRHGGVTSPVTSHRSSHD